jgi:UDP-N-acetylmuramate dehydrogenase
MNAVEQAAAMLGERATRDVPIGPLTTYRVGGSAALFVEARNVDDLLAVGAAHRRTGLPVAVIGKGSNLLVADGGFRGIALTIAPFASSIAIDGTTVHAGGAVSCAFAARRFSTTRWCSRRRSPWHPATGTRPNSYWPTSCAGDANTSPVARTAARCS